MTTSLPKLETSSNIADLMLKRADAQAALDRVDELLEAERVGVIALVQGYIHDFKIKSSEAYPAPPKKKVQADKDYNPDYFYKDPTTGEVWDGKGKKRPNFLRGKKKLETFRVYHSATTQAPENSNSIGESIGQVALVEAAASIDQPAHKATAVQSTTVSEPEAASTAVLVQESAASVPSIVNTPTSATPADSAATQLSGTS